MPDPRRRSSLRTLVLQLFSVWISDGSWSYWNWISYAIANAVDTDSPNSLSAFFCGSLVGFGLNGLFFYCVHNFLRFFAIKYMAISKDTLWYCDLHFAGLVFGAYYGFGPFAVSIALAFNAASLGEIAACNALGTFLGTCIFVVLFYAIPIYFLVHFYEEKAHQSTGTDGSSARMSNNNQTHSEIEMGVVEKRSIDAEFSCENPMSARKGTKIHMEIDSHEDRTKEKKLTGFLSSNREQ